MTDLGVVTSEVKDKSLHFRNDALKCRLLNHILTICPIYGFLSY